MINTPPFLALFVPGTRPDRFSKAALSGADAIIIDLEDAVAKADRPTAREMIRSALVSGSAYLCEVYIRINGSETDDHESDLTLLDCLPNTIGIVLAKAENPRDIVELRKRYPSRRIIGLIETAKGIASARGLAPLVNRLAFGSIDYANSLGAAHSDRALLAARSELVFACAFAGCPGPIDGVTTSISSKDAVFKDSVAAKELGFKGKLLIHPSQVIESLKAMVPDEDKIDEARRMLAAVGVAASGFEGKMVDAPVLLAARKLVQEHEALQLRIENLINSKVMN
ncbi:HpcH/HpaI aldolase/citrate lyase family protein [Pseudomonas pergaminensis]